MSIDPIRIIEKYYDRDSKAYFFLIHHGKMVAQKALELAERVEHLAPDIEFIREAAMLHDIGILFTDAPAIGCFGYKDYICHGYLGRDLLEKEGFLQHALVCERHVGTGITVQDIRDNRLPLPEREMVPVTVEEKIVCLADKFFSKSDHDLLHEKPLSRVRQIIARYGADKLRVFDEWVQLFGLH